MKKVLIHIAFVIVILVKNEDVYAQTDSLKVEYKQETIDSSDYTFRRKYKYLDILLKEEKNLLKFGLAPTIIATSNSFQLPVNITFEKKILPEWSLFTNLYSSVSFFKGTSGTVYQGAGFGFSIGTRYYYGMKKAIRKGETANNFNRNYFQLTMPPFSYSYFTEKVNGESKSYSSTNKFKQYGSVAWGIQRRLTNYSYIDTNISFVLKQSYPTFPGIWYVALGVNVGFGANIRHRH